MILNVRLETIWGEEVLMACLRVQLWLLPGRIEYNQDKNPIKTTGFPNEILSANSCVRWQANGFLQLRNKFQFIPPSNANFTLEISGCTIV
jgi:hypothetical protein